MSKIKNCIVYIHGGIGMNDAERKEILDKSKEFFANEIVPKHLRNTIRASKLSAYNVNPFLVNYLAQFAFGDTTPESLAKTLIYPRILGTSINTTFGNAMQKYCMKVLSGNGSTTPGMDIEFIDCVDGMKKYCQIKAGPQTINKDDVDTIKSHFRALIRQARTNNMRVANSDCVVGVLYGDARNVSNFYKTIDEDYVVYVGKDFWYHLTGDAKFYEKLIKTFADIVKQRVTSSSALSSAVTTLADEIKNNSLF